MGRIATIAAALAITALPAMGQDAASQAVVDRMKAGKLVPIADIATLMMGAERWCYQEKEGECAWSDIYLSVDAKGASFELSNPWSEAIDISFVDVGEFKDGRYICETGNDWLPTLRAYSREDGTAIEGRDLAALKLEVDIQLGLGDDKDCFDYLFQGADAGTETVTLLQRQYVDGRTDPANDAVVTLHFDKESADDLGWYW